MSSVFEQPQTTKKRDGRQPGRALRYAKGFARGLLHHPTGHYRRAALQPIPRLAKTFHLLDAVRGAAALTIVLFHFKNLGADFWPTTSESEKATAFRWLLDPILAHGANAVALFWVISGAVMMHVYGHQAKTISSSTYINRRIARLYPLHLVTLLILAALQSWSQVRFGTSQIYENNDLYHFALQLAFASNWGFEDGLSFNGPIWSVSCEVLAYAGFLVFLKFTPVNRLTVFLALSVTAVAHKFIDSSISYCFVCFFAGSFAYSLLPPPGSRKTNVLFGTTAMIILATCLTVEFNAGLRVLFSLTAIVAIAMAIDSLFDLAKVPLLGWLGDISYSSYLWHTPILVTSILLLGEIGAGPAVVNSNTMFIAYVAMVLLVSTLSYRFFEVPTQRYIRNIRSK